MLRAERAKEVTKMSGGGVFFCSAEEKIGQHRRSREVAGDFFRSWSLSQTPGSARLRSGRADAEESLSQKRSWVIPGTIIVPKLTA